jgi:hypothetical protein
MISEYKKQKKIKKTIKWKILLILKSLIESNKNNQ